MKRIVLVLSLVLMLLFGTAHAQGMLFVPGEELPLFQHEDYQMFLTGNYREIMDDAQYPMGAVALEYCFVNNSNDNVKYTISIDSLNEQSYDDGGLDFSPVVKPGKSRSDELILDAAAADAYFQSFEDLESLPLAAIVWPPEGHTSLYSPPSSILYFSPEAALTYHVAAVSGSETVIFDRFGLEARLFSWEFADNAVTFHGEFKNNNSTTVIVHSTLRSLDETYRPYVQCTLNGEIQQFFSSTLSAGASTPFTMTCPYVQSIPEEIRMGFTVYTTDYDYTFAEGSSGRIKLYHSEEERLADDQSVIEPLSDATFWPSEENGSLFRPGEELLLAFSPEFSLWLTGEYRDAENDPSCPRGTVYLGYRIENHSSYKAELYSRGYLNGARISDSLAILGKAVASGKELKGELELKSSNVGVYFETLADLESMFLVINPYYDDCFDVALPGREVIFNQAGMQTANCAVISGNEYVVIDEQDVTFTLKSCLCLDKSILLYCELDNQSPEDIYFVYEGSVNGFVALSDSSGYINGKPNTCLESGAKGNALIVLNAQEHISDVDNVSLYVTVHKNKYKGSSDYDIDYLNPEEYFSARTGRLKFYVSAEEHAADTQTQFVPLEELRKPYTPPVDPMHEYTSREIIRLAQEAMNSLGYECGTPDGIIGNKTAAALSAFQREYALAETGSVTHQTAEVLAELGYNILGE